MTIIAKPVCDNERTLGWYQTSEINPPYDLVSLLIGVNNQYRGYDINQYREQFVFLLNKSIEYAGGNPKRVMIVSVPDWGVTPFAHGLGGERIARDIDAFNAVNRAETEKAGAQYINITPISRDAAHDVTLIAGDGLHPQGRCIWNGQSLPTRRLWKL